MTATLVEEAVRAAPSESARARAVLMDALMRLDNGKHWVKGEYIRSSRPEPDGEWEFGYCALGATDVSAVNAGYLVHEYGLPVKAGTERHDPIARAAVRALALAFSPEAKCYAGCPLGKHHGPDHLCDLCAADTVACGNDASDNFTPVGQAFGRAIAGLTPE